MAYNSQINLNSLAETIMDIIGYTVPIRYEPPRAGDIHDSRADISKASKEFGYSPDYTVKTGLIETVRWYQERTRTSDN